MATIFISHASKDDATVDQLHAWLQENGFTSVFVDHLHIAPGEKWADALTKSAGACRVVLFLITPNWLSSAECEGEFLSAFYMGRRLIPLLLLGDSAITEEKAAGRLRRVLGHDQGLDLSKTLTGDGRLDPDSHPQTAEVLRLGLRAAGAQTKVGLSPEVFAIDKAKRPSPFPGLSSFGDDDADAALFYGRSLEIAQTMERLRESRAKGDRTPLMILGASGSGKSSLLKAGVIPRLRRETPAWLPVRAFRPGADPLFNFADALARTLSDFGDGAAPGALRRELEGAWRAAERTKDGSRIKVSDSDLLSALDPIGERLRRAANRESATLLLSIDQAEELARSEGDSGEALCDFLRATVSPDSAVDWRLAFTIRSDSLPELLRDPRFEGLDKNGITLRALPTFRFADVVEQPAKRYEVEIEPELVNLLAEDAPQSDALPLLAYAMERLWSGFSLAGRIRAEDYLGLGRINGLIEDGAERALAGVSPKDDKPRPSSPPAERLRLAEEAFVPALAQVNDDGDAIRRVAPWSEFSDKAKELLSRFDEWRLVVRKLRRGQGEGESEDDGDTVEVAHEALFREWARLKNWLEPERERLDALRGVQVAASAWDRGGRRAAALTHFGARLKQAREIAGLKRYAARLSDIDQAYIAACRTAERTARRQRLALQATAGVLGVGLIGAGFYIPNQEAVDPWVDLQVSRALYVDLKEVVAAQEKGRGANFNECPDLGCPSMVVLPAGKFRMGSPDGKPQIEVTIPAPFAVAKYEVTFAEWDKCADFTARHRIDFEDYGCAPIEDDRGWGRGSRPVINVTWEMAQGYVRWLNMRVTGAKEGPYRLLSEAEWEYAARGVTSLDAPHTKWGFGDEAAKLGDYAWFAENSDRGEGERTHPVGEKLPNAFGLHDMHGNVWEWVQDCWVERLDASLSKGESRKKVDCSIDVLRGGSWSGDPRSLRSANRDGFPRGPRSSGIGFRLARTLRE